MVKNKNHTETTDEDGTPIIKCNCGKEYVDTAEKVVREITPMIISIDEKSGRKFYNLGCPNCGIKFRENVDSKLLYEKV